MTSFLEQHADLFRRLAIRDHHVYDNAIALGFAEREHVPELSDKPVSELVYLHREKVCMPLDGIALAQAFTQHQYVSLTHYEGRFLEAVVEVFHVSRNGKTKKVGKLRDQQLKGATPLYSGIARDWATLAGMVAQVYPLTKD